VEALRGRVRGVHRFRLKQQLERVDFIDAQIAQLEAEIEKQNALYWRPVWNLLEGQFDLLLANATHMRNVPGRKTDIKDSEWIAQLLPFDEAVSLLAEIPGFDRTTAWSVIAEIGIDMNQFPSADHLASWAGVCPGNNESGGKRLSGKTRKGSRWLRGQLLRPAQSGKTYSLFRQTANPTWPQSHPRTVFGRSLNPFQESYGLAMEASGLKSTRPTALTRNPDRGRSGVFRTVYSGVRGFESDP
jgi:hypothetical protein